ncbi:TIGR04104 family putative zinc finger protein [Priestia aryabhattai]
MAKCKKCEHQWSWKQSFKKLFTFKNKVLCPSCQEAQYVSKKSRDSMSIIAMFPLLISLPLVSFNIPTGYLITLEVFCYLIVFLVLPFFYDLSNKEERMF